MPGKKLWKRAGIVRVSLAARAGTGTGFRLGRVAVVAVVEVAPVVSMSESSGRLSAGVVVSSVVLSPAPWRNSVADAVANAPHKARLTSNRVISVRISLPLTTEIERPADTLPIRTIAVGAG